MFYVFVNLRFIGKTNRSTFLSLLSPPAPAVLRLAIRWDVSAIFAVVLVFAAAVIGVGVVIVADVGFLSSRFDGKLVLWLARVNVLNLIAKLKIF